MACVLAERAELWLRALAEQVALLLLQQQHHAPVRLCRLCLEPRGERCVICEQD